MIDANEALQQLQEGNARFIASGEEYANFQDPAHLSVDPSPDAILLGCSDARVVPEILFDQGLGELFVVRVAGNVASPDVMASLEFAVLRFGSPLLVVLGHTDCGAVAATIAELTEPTSDIPRNVKALVDRMSPAIKSVRPAEDEDDPGVWMELGVQANLAASLRHLRQSPGPIKDAVQAGTLKVVGAEYNLATGAVEFLD